MKKYFIIILILAFSAVGLQAKTEKYLDYRLSLAEMQDVASSTKLFYRVFYEGGKVPTQKWYDALKRGEFSMPTELVDYKGSIGPDAKWFDAVKKGNLAEVKAMVEAGQNLEVKDTGALDQTALVWATFIGYEDMVKYLISKGADINGTDVGDVYNVFKSAVLGNNVKVVQYLYPLFKKEGFNINNQEADGETFVMIAASNDRMDIVKFLIKEGADVNIVSEQRQQNPLTAACQGGYMGDGSKPYTEVANYLISKGAVNFKTGKASC